MKQEMILIYPVDSVIQGGLASHMRFCQFSQFLVSNIKKEPISNNNTVNNNIVNNKLTEVYVKERRINFGTLLKRFFVISTQDPKSQTIVMLTKPVVLHPLRGQIVLCYLYPNRLCTSRYFVLCYLKHSVGYL